MTRTLFGLILFSCFATQAHAAVAPQTFTVDGTLYQSTAAGAPTLLDSGTMKISVLSPDATCILYQEQQNFNTTTSNGVFSLQVGSNPGAAKRTASDAGNGMPTVFSNTIITGISGKMASDGTTPCTYTPVGGDNRLVRVTVTPVSTGIPQTLSPDLAMNSAPSSVVAERAENLQGYGPANLLILGNGSTSQSNIDNVFSATNYPRLTDLLSVGVGSYVRTGSNGSAALPSVAGNPASPAAGQIWYDSTANQMKYYNGTATQALSSGVTSITASTGLTGGTITSTGTIGVDVGVTAGKIVQVQTGGKLPALDASNLSNIPASQLSGTISGAIAINTSSYIQTSNNITATGNGTTTGVVTGQTLSGGQVNTNMLRLADSQPTPNYVELKAVSNLGGANKTFTWPSSYGTSGYVLSTDGAGVLSWIANGSGGGVSSVGNVNGQTTIGGTASNPTVGLATSGVSAATYGSSSLIPILTVDTYGRITSASSTSLSSSAVTGALGYTPVSKAGDTMTGLLVLSADPSAASGAATKQYVDAVSTTAAGAYIRKDGTTQLTADWDLDGASATGTWHITGLANPIAADGAATKSYADTNLIGKALPSSPSAGQSGQALRWNNGTSAWEYFTPSTGTVTSVSGTTGRITNTGTASAPVLDLVSSGVSAGTYGSSSQIPILTFDTYGRVTSATYASIAAGGVTSVASVSGQTVVTGTASSPVVGLATSGVSAATYGSSSLIPVLTVDQFGRITVASTQAVSVTETDPTVATFAKAATGLTARLTTTANQLDLASSGVGAGTYGSSSQIPILTLDTYGRVTSATYASIAAGGVTSVASVSGQTVVGGTASSPTVGLATTGVGAGTYGSSSQIPIFTLDSYGRVTTASYLSASIAPGQLTAGGASTSNFLQWNGSNWAAASFSAAVSSAESDPTVPSYFKTAPQPRIVNNAGKIDLATSGVSAATYGSSSLIPVLTVDQYGRITLASTASLSESDPTVATFAKSATGLTARLTTTANQLDLASSGVGAGTYGSSSQVPILTVDTYGRVTSATYASIASSGVSSVASVSGQTVVGGTASNPTVGLAASGVSAATYGSSSLIPVLTVDQYGRITLASTASLSESDPTVATYAKAATGLTSRLTTTANQLDLASSGVSAGTYGSSSQVPILTVDTYGRITIASTASVSVTETDPTVATFAKTATGLTSRLTTTANQLDLASSGVGAGTYGSSSQVPILTVDSYGRVTNASYLSASIAPSQITAGGASSNNVLKWTGSQWSPTAVSNLETDPTVATYAKSNPTARFNIGTGYLDLATSGVSAGTYGSSSQIPILTVDQYGRVTSASTASLNAYSAGSTILASFGSAAAPGLSFNGDSGTGIYEASANMLGFATGGTQKMVIDSTGAVGIGTASPQTKLDVNGTINMRQAYYENAGALGTLACGSTNITGFTTNIYTLTACASGTTTLNIPAVTGMPTGAAWTVTFFVTGQTSSVFNVSLNGATTTVYWDKNSTGGTGGASYAGFTVTSGHTDMITCMVLQSTGVAYCGVSAQY